MSQIFVHILASNVSASLRYWPAMRCRWIGNAAEDGRAGTVFARLKVPAPDGSGTLVDHGVHAIVVPLRSDTGSVLPGIEIKDCGYKVRSLHQLHTVKVLNPIKPSLYKQYVHIAED